MDKIRILETLDEIKTFSDPYRLQILSTLKKIKRPATVKQIADSMGEVPAKVHYHVKKMEKSGVLRLVYTEEVNGIVAKYYEPTAEHFSIRSEELSHEVSKLVLNETQNVIAFIYDESKRITLNELKKGIIEPEDRGGLLIRSSKVYMTNEKAQELEALIQDFLDKYDNKESDLIKDSNIQEYHIFNVILRLEDEK